MEFNKTSVFCSNLKIDSRIQTNQIVRMCFVIPVQEYKPKDNNANKNIILSNFNVPFKIFLWKKIKKRTSIFCGL